MEKQWLSPRQLLLLLGKRPAIRRAILCQKRAPAVASSQRMHYKARTAIRKLMGSPMKSDAPDDLIKRFFGEWTGPIGDIFRVVSVLCVGIFAAVSAAKSLGSPITRWVLLSALFLLFLGAYFFKRTPAPVIGREKKLILGADEQPFTVQPRTSGFGWAALGILAFLGTDIVRNISGVWLPVETRQIELPSDGVRVAVTKDDAEFLRERHVVSFHTLGHGQSSNCVVESAIRKLEGVEEVTIEEIQVEIVDFVSSPSQLSAPYSVGYSVIEPVTYTVHLQRQRHPLPWTLRADTVWVDGEYHKREDVTISLRDGFQLPLRIELIGGDPGIYTLVVKLRVSSGLSAPRTISLHSEPLTFAFVMEPSEPDSRTTPTDAKCQQLIVLGKYCKEPIEREFSDPAETIPIPEGGGTIRIPDEE